MPAFRLSTRSVMGLSLIHICRDEPVALQKAHRPRRGLAGCVFAEDTAGTNRLLHEGRARAACSGADLVQTLGLQASRCV